tara:strand:+ start:670 stop:897 length:228 start_codon:yes stop_codon:yes gene_type:complete
MTIKFPKTYEDLKKAEYIYDVEICDSGVFIYIEEKFIQNHADKTAWGEKNLKQALQMLKTDFWDSIKKYHKEVNK